MKRRKKNNLIIHISLSAFGFMLVFPIIWLFFAALKPNNEIMNTINILPSSFIWTNFAEGWTMVKPYMFSRFYFNTFVMVFGCVLGSLVSSTLVGFGFARMKFRLNKFLFSVLFSTIMLPGIIVMIPMYIIFSNIGWLNSIKPFVVPSFLGVGEGGVFFIFMMHQFLKGIPKELDESAKIDGCGAMRTLLQVLVPLCKPALFSICIFSFMWNWDNFQAQLIYLNDVKKFTVSLALRTTIDVSGAENWGAIMAMSLVAVLPAIILFFTAQKYFVEGIATTGLKG